MVPVKIAPPSFEVPVMATMAKRGGCLIQRVGRRLRVPRRGLRVPCMRKAPSGCWAEPIWGGQKVKMAWGWLGWLGFGRILRSSSVRPWMQV